MSSTALLLIIPKFPFNKIRGNFDIQNGCLSKAEQYVGGPVSVPSGGNEDDDRLIQVCSHHRLFRVNTDFCNKKRYRLGWRLLLPLNSFEMKVIILSSVTGELSATPVNTGALWFVLAFVCVQPKTAPTQKPEVLQS